VAGRVPVAAPPARHVDAAELCEAAEAIARQAGELIAERYEQGGAEHQKGHAHNLVTATDLASEALMTAALRARFPGHRIVAEEGGDLSGDDPDGPDAVTWVVDPLDGTNNFAHGVPIFCATLAALVGGVPVAGATFDPLRDELFAAAQGQGAFLNGRPLRVSRRETLDQSLVVTGFPYDKSSNPDNNVAEVVAVVPHVRGFRRTGSAAIDLAWVAAGRFEAYWERGTKAWDVAAGVLLVQEAGGYVTDMDGGPVAVDGGRFLASNGRVHQALLERLRAASPLRGALAAWLPPGGGL